MQKSRITGKGRTSTAVWVTNRAYKKLQEASKATGLKMCEITDQALLALLGSGEWSAKIAAAKTVRRLEADLEKARKALSKFK